MGGYIGATAVGLTTTAADVQGDITSTDTTPELILKNTSEEDTEGGREGKITFKGEQSGGEESTLAQIESAHDGTSDDQKGDLIFKTNDGSDGASPTERMRIDSDGLVTVSGSLDLGTTTDAATVSTTASDYQLQLGAAQSTTGDIGRNISFDISGTTTAAINSVDGGTSNAQALAFFTGNGSGISEAMRIDSIGKVGIGTSSPDTPLHVVDSSTAYVLSETTGTGTSAGFRLKGDASADFTLFTTQGTNQFAIYDNASSAERMRIDSSGRVGIATNNPNAMLTVHDDSAVTGNANLMNIYDSQNRIGVYYLAGNASYTSVQELRYTTRTAGNDYFFARYASAAATDTEYNFRGDGNAFAEVAWNGGGADYAEYFEWVDGNTDNEDRVGFTVVLDNEKIRKATSSDDASNIIGAVSANPSVVGDCDMGDNWKNKYLKDDFNRFIYDTHNVVEWTEEVDGEEVKHSYEDWNLPDGVTVPDNATTLTENDNGNPFTHRRLNPDYDPDREYVGREFRQEWSTIGMMGKLRIRTGQPTGDRWIKMRDISDTVEEWLVR